MTVIFGGIYFLIHFTAPIKQIFYMKKCNFFTPSLFRPISITGTSSTNLSFLYGMSEAEHINSAKVLKLGEEHVTV